MGDKVKCASVINILTSEIKMVESIKKRIQFEEEIENLC